MTGINIEIKRWIIAASIVISVITPCSTILSDRRLCFDPKCSVPVAKGYTLLTYHSNNPDVMSFRENMDVTVYSKEAGKIRDFWGVEINGKRGYVPRKLIREKTTLKKLLVHEVPTEAIYTKSDEKSKEEETSKDEDVIEPSEKLNVGDTENVERKQEEERKIPDPSHVTPSFEVHDGTTIPLSVNEENSEPSYSTIVPGRGVPDIDQQPILSVHPNIVSSSTLKNRENDISSEVNEGSTESYVKLSSSIADESKNVEIEDENDENDQEEDDEDEDDKLPGGEDTSSNDENSPEPEKLASEETSHVEKTTTENIDDPRSRSKRAEDDTSNEVDDSIKDDGYSTDLDVAVTEEKIANVTIPEEPTSDVESDDTSKAIDDNVPEATTEQKPLEPEFSGNNEGETKNVVEESVEKFDEKNVPQDSKITSQEESLDSVNSDEIPEIADVESAKTSGTESSNDDDRKIADSPESLPTSANEIEQSAEENNAETPLNLNIVNPLFNRLSMLPSMVREVVVDTLSSKSPETLGSSEEAVDESVATIHEEIAKNHSNIDNFTTDSNDSNNDIDIEPQIPVDTTITDDKGQHELTDNNNDDNNNNDSNIDSGIKKNYSTADSSDTLNNNKLTMEKIVQPGIYEEDEKSGFSQENFPTDETTSFNGFPANRNLLNVGSGLQRDDHSSKNLEIEKLNNIEMEKKENAEIVKSEDPEESKNSVMATTEKTVISESMDLEIAKSVDQKSESEETIESPSTEDALEQIKIPVDTIDNVEGTEEKRAVAEEVDDDAPGEEVDITDVLSIGRKYWETLTYLVVTAFTSLLFSLGYYYIENSRRDGQYIAKINKLEKELLVCTKECTVLDDTLKSTKSKLDSIEDESFGSNEMVASLKADLETYKTAKSELEDQVGMLEKELESATEAGLELERMLREILSTNNAENPLAQSVEDLQTRLNAQQAANEALTNALNLKAQENETLTAELKAMTEKSEQLEVEVSRLTQDLKHQTNIKSNLEHSLMEKVENLEKQVKDITAERLNLRKQLKGKEMELEDLLNVVDQMNINNLDFEKLYNVSRVKAEAGQLLEERDELKIRLSEVEGAHQLLEEHVKLINEEVSSLSEQCKIAEKAKRDAETRVEVLSNFFKEKEAQRQKEEAIWLEKQGEVSSTVERLHTMQNEIHNYKQQIEMLKREILDQEREYKNQIAAMETKSHEQWVIARQNERRLEESKAEAGQLRNRLTLIEKNLNDADPEAKLHRLESNGDATATSPQLFMGAEASSSPIMFAGSSGVPPMPPPPSYIYGPPVPPFMPPPPHSTSGHPSYEVGQRPPPLGGRLSSPPPPPPPPASATTTSHHQHHYPSSSGRYDNSRSSPSPLSPTIAPPYGPPQRAFPPPFPNDRVHLPAPPQPHSSMLPPFFPHMWPDEAIPPPLRNSGFQGHSQQQQSPPPLPHHHHQQQQQQQPQSYHHRDHQRARNHKGSLHSSGESLDKNL